jgi:YVTN family beta-propeller protein
LKEGIFKKLDNEKDIEMEKIIKNRLLQVIILTIATGLPLLSQTPSGIDTKRVTLPNGWSLTPVGKMVAIGDLPLNIAISPDRKLAAVTNNGESDQSIELIDIQNGWLLDSVPIRKAWLGLVFSNDGKSLFASGGNDNWIIRYALNKNRITPADTFKIGKPWPVKIGVAGIAVDAAKRRLYAVTNENNSIYVIDINTKKVLSTTPLGGEGYTCILSTDHKTLYATCWGCDKVVLFDTDQQKIKGSIAVGDNPNDMCLTKSGAFLFVANANDNSVSVIDTRKNKVIETLNCALYPGAPSGATTNSVALSTDEKKLYAANADNNCIAVFDMSNPGFSKGMGFIPTGWYPSCVRVAKDLILVSNGKGLTSMANPFGPSPVTRGQEVVYQEGGRQVKVKVQYIGGLFKGTLGIINTPDEKTLGEWSKAVYRNTPYIKDMELLAEGEAGNPVPQKVGDKSPVKHVFYIIKENRTYDQILGDMKEANGDANLCLFGENITPNQHALAREFVLLDNFFVNGEVSADGHNWSMGGYATDYLEKTWPTSYGGRGGSYSAEGGREIANNKNGFIWDDCARSKVSYRTYGEFMADEGKPNIPVLNGHYCPYFATWDQMIRDTVRFREWKRDFDSLLAINSVPQFNTIRFINDHTLGLSKGKPSPFAQVADNDLAVGMFVDYLSHSSIWNSSVVFILEDDAQNGPDHVDAHRSPLYIAGGFVKKGFIDHTAYTTTSVLRTIELILGMPPMTQYDAGAVPLWRCFDKVAGHPVFNARPATYDLNERNTAENKWQKMSERFDFTAEDRVNDSEFNEVIWKAVRGVDSPCPASVRAAFLTTGGEEDDD